MPRHREPASEAIRRIRIGHKGSGPLPDIPDQKSGEDNPLLELGETVKEELAFTIEVDLAKNYRMPETGRNVITQARAEAEQAPAQRALHAEPDTISVLGRITEQAATLAAVASELDSEEIPLTRAEAEMAIKGLWEITTQSSTTAWQLGLHAVERGLMSQTRLAELLDSSSATVSRRYREDTTEGQE